VDPRELDAYLDRVLIGDREPGPVVLVEWDPAWPARFERERPSDFTSPGHRMFRTPDLSVQIHVWGDSDGSASTRTPSAR
jgi:hypothetical protein